MELELPRLLAITTAYLRVEVRSKSPLIGSDPIISLLDRVSSGIRLSLKLAPT